MNRAGTPPEYRALRAIMRLAAFVFERRNNRPVSAADYLVLTLEADFALDRLRSGWAWTTLGAMRDRLALEGSPDPDSHRVRRAH